MDAVKVGKPPHPAFPDQEELMNRTAKVVKQSVMAAMLVIVSVYVGVQFGATVGKHQSVARTLEKPGMNFILTDGTVFCPKC